MASTVAFFAYVRAQRLPLRVKGTHTIALIRDGVEVAEVSFALHPATRLVHIAAARTVDGSQRRGYGSLLAAIVVKAARAAKFSKVTLVSSHIDFLYDNGNYPNPPPSTHMMRRLEFKKVHEKGRPGHDNHAVHFEYNLRAGTPAATRIMRSPRTLSMRTRLPFFVA
jgi:hypothetical protein